MRFITARKRSGIGLILACTLLLLAAYASADVGLDVPKRSESDIAAFVADHPAATPAQIYAEEPVLDAPDYQPGRLTDEALQAALNALNQVRYAAGLSAVTLNAEYTRKCQAGTLVNAANGVMSHYPTQPEGMSDELFNLGYAGTSHSNLGRGYRNLSSAVFDGWMDDGDSSNIDRIGHRRWALNPRMASTGFGQVGAYTAMYSVDTSSSASIPETVAWPAQLMPARWMYSGLPWHVSFKTGVSDASSVRVKMTRRGDSKTWNFSTTDADGYFNINSGGYGTGTAVIFRPSNIEYCAGDIFDVSITGVLSDTLSYTVELYSYDIQHMRLQEIAPQMFTGAEIRPEVVLFCGSSVLREGTDYTVEYKYNTNAGNYARITITGQGKYSGSRTDYFTILPADISSAEFTVQNPSYTGSVLYAPGITGMLGSFELEPFIDFEITEYTSLINAGDEGTVTIKGVGNITGEQKLTYHVLPREMTDVILALEQDSFVYCGAPCEPTLWYVRFNGSDLKSGTDYLLTYENNTNAGTAAAIIKGQGNFSGEERIEFSISTLPVYYADMSLEYTQCVYHGEPCTPGLSTARYGKYDLIVDTDYTLSYANNDSEGYATVTVTGEGNCSGTRELYFYIGMPVDISYADVSLEYTSCVYTGEAMTPAVTVDYGATRLTEETDYTVAYTNNIDPGQATVTITGTGDYTGSVSSCFIIKANDEDPENPDNPDNPARLYTVTVSTDGNGTASADRNSGKKGDAVSLTFKANEGYYFSCWKVISGDVQVENNQFVIGNANVEIRALFAKIENMVSRNGLRYTLNHKKKTATVTGPIKKSLKKAVIPSTVDANNTVYKVTAIAKGAFKGLKKLKTLTIGANVKSIGKDAFRDCVKLKTVTIKTKKLTVKNVGTNAFKNNPKKAIYYCPKSKIKAYKKLLIKRGASKSATFGADQ